MSYFKYNIVNIYANLRVMIILQIVKGVMKSFRYGIFVLLFFICNGLISKAITSNDDTDKQQQKQELPPKKRYVVAFTTSADISQSGYWLTQADIANVARVSSICLIVLIVFKF